MKRMRLLLIALTVALLPGSYLLVAQQPAQQPPAGGGQGRGGAPGAPGGAPGGGARGPVQPMSFFITSVGKGDGANLGGIAGADAHCQTLAAAAGRGGVTWHAYLSTQGPAPSMRATGSVTVPGLTQRPAGGAERRANCMATRSSRRASATRSASSSR